MRTPITLILQVPKSGSTNNVIISKPLHFGLIMLFEATRIGLFDPDSVVLLKF